MKLHLPKKLFTALMACLASFSGLSTTIGTGFVAGGAVTIAFVAQEARADANLLNIPYGGNMYAGDYTLNFTVAGGQTGADDPKDVLALYWSSFSINEYYSNGITIGYADGKRTLYIGDGQMGNVSGGADQPEITESTTFEGSRGASFISALSENQSYTITNFGRDQKQITILSGGDLKKFEVVTYNGNMYGSSIAGSVGNNAYGVANQGVMSDTLVWKGGDGNWVAPGNDAVVDTTSENWTLNGSAGGWIQYGANALMNAEFQGSGGRVTVADAGVVAKKVTVSGTGWIWTGGAVTADSIEVAESSSLSIENSLTLSSVIKNAGSLEIVASEGMTITCSAAITDAGTRDGAAYKYTIVDGGNVSLEGADTSEALKSLFVGGFQAIDDAVWSFQDGILSITGDAESAPTWSQGDLTWTDDCSMDNGVVFDNGEDHVTFKDNGTITLGVDITAKEMVVLDNENLTIAGDKSLTADSLTVGDGAKPATLTISNTGSKTFTNGVNIADGGTLIVADDTGWSDKSPTGASHSGIVFGNGILEIATGNAYTTNGSIGGFFDKLIGRAHDSLGTIRFSNGTSVLQNSTSGGEWEWLKAADTVEIMSDAHVSIGANYDFYNNKDNGKPKAADVFKIAGAGLADAEAGSEKASALAFVMADNGWSTSLGALHLMDDATVYSAKGVTGTMVGAFTTNDHVLTKTGEGTVNSTGAASGDVSLNIQAGMLGVNTTAVKKLEGTGVFSKLGDGEMSISDIEDISGFTGGFNVAGGTLNFDTEGTHVATKLSFAGSGAATGNVKTGTNLSVTQLLLADVVNTTLNIESGAALTVTGDPTKGYGDNTEFRTLCTFLLNHYNCDTVFNINGLFNMLNNPYVSTVNRAADKVVINVNDGGVYNAAGFVLVDRDSSGGNATLNLKSGATLNLGSWGMAANNVSRQLSEISRDTLVLNIESGATFGILDGAEKWSTERNLSWSGDVIFNTQGYKVAENGIGGTREGGSAGVIELLGTVSGGITKNGVGKLVLGHGSVLTSVAVNDGTVAFAGDATITTLSLAANTGLILNAGGAIDVASFDKTNFASLKLQVDGAINEVGTYTLMTGDGATGFSVSEADGIVLSELANGLAFDSLVDGVLTIKQGIAAAVGALTWETGDEDNVWRNSPIYQNWLLDGAADAQQRWTDASNAFFTGAGETVTIEGTVTPNSVAVTGTGWEWEGDGSVSTATTLTIGDDAATASELTISNTGSKTFIGGVIVKDGATLTLTNRKGWNGVVSGDGTFVIAIGESITLNTDTNFLSEVVGDEGKQLAKLVIDGNTSFTYSDGYLEDINTWVRNVSELEIKAGSSMVTNGAGMNNPHLTLKIAGDGSNATAAYSNAFLGQTIGKLILTDDAAVLVSWAGFDINVADAYDANGHCLTKKGAGAINVAGKSTLTDGSGFDVQAGAVNLNGGGVLAGTITKTGTQNLNLSGAVTLQNDTTLDVQAGTLAISTPIVSEQTINKKGAGTLLIGNGGSTTVGTGLADISVQGGTLKFHLSTEDERAYDGKISLSGDTELHVDAGETNFTGGIAVSGDVRISTNWNDAIRVRSLIEGAAGSTITLVDDIETSSKTPIIELHGENSFAGTWNVGDSWAVHAANEKALANATVNLQGGDSYLWLATDRVQLAALTSSDSNGVVTCQDGNNVVLELLTDGKSEYTGEIQSGVSIVMSGTGEQILAEAATPWGSLGADITVNSGTLTIGSEGGMGVQTQYGQTVTLAKGATLKSSLMLMGGTLALDITGANTEAASLGGNVLTLSNQGLNLTSLNLTMLDNVKSGDTFTLMKGIASLGNGLDLTGSMVGDYFDVASISILSSQGVAVVADGENVSLRSDLTAERLERSKLYFENGELKLTLAESVLNADPLYWDPADGTGSGNWQASNWSNPKEAMGIDPGVMADGWYGDVIFTNQEDVAAGGQTSGTVTIDTAAVVDDLTVESGAYTFVKGTYTDADKNTKDGSLAVEGTLSVAADASADLQLDIDAYRVDVKGSLTADNITLGKKDAVGKVIDGALTAAFGSSLTIDGVDGNGSVTINGATLSGVLDGRAANQETGDSGLSIAVNGATVVVNTSLSLSDAGLGGSIANSGTVSFSGNMDIMSGLTGEDGSTFSTSKVMSESGTVDGDGYLTKSVNYTLTSGTGTVSNTATWTVGGDSTGVTSNGNTVSQTTGKDLKAYWVNNSVTQSEAALDETTIKFVLNGGKLTMDGESFAVETNADTTLQKELADGTKDSASVIVLSGKLNASDLTINAGTSVAMGGSGTYNLGAGTALADKLSLGAADAAWTGTVTTSAISVSDISALGHENSTVDLTGDVVTESLTTGTVGKVTVKSLEAGTLGAAQSDVSIAGATTLKKDSIVGTAAFNGGLTLGTEDGAAILTGEELTLSTLNMANLNSAVEAARLSKDSLDIRIDKSLLSKLTPGDYRTLVTLWDDDTLASLSFNGESDCILEEKGAKYLYSIGWEEAEPVAPLATDNTTAGTNGEGTPGGTVDNVLPPADVVVLTTVQNPNYMKEKYSDMEENALAGAELLDDAFIQYDPQASEPEGDIASIIDAVDNNNISQDDLAAVAGSSIATLGMALSGDVERQLRAIRNRTTSMGVNECVVNEGMPYFNAWVNAEGNRAELDKDETLAGYTLDSWGGTIGFDVDLNPNLTVGMAITAMYGDLQADGPETKAEGDMDTYYVSLFARYASCAWTHTFVATVGMMDGSFDRTVGVGNGYETEGTTDGMSFGLMYEVGYVMPLDEDATACLQPVFNVMLRHSTVGSYTEEGGDAALDVESQSMTTLTFGLGARLQAVVGESVYNRASIFEARVLGKVDVGDRESEADVAFAGGSGHSATVRSAELGAFGVELGAGLTIPMGDDDGSIFVDGSVEMRSGYTNFNGTVGYRINF